MKTLFTSNHEEANTKIVYCCSSFNKSCIVKAKETDILILIIYAMQFNSLSTIGTCEQLKILLLALEKCLKNLAVPLGCCCQSFIQSQVEMQFITSLIFPNVFEWASSGITSFKVAVHTFFEDISHIAKTAIFHIAFNPCVPKIAFNKSIYDQIKQNT